MRKKGQLGWDNIYTWVLVLAFLVVILIMIFTNRERMVEILDSVKSFLRFGGG
ncbi:hypothetical protein HOG16_01290 [Candidatus Woesearchaeota archaeon]|jgi:hypothetical protein|nr:hypothetical protein [Candidatus Woesearchaeota archaeon]MBT4321760.1 hypothetical protein [Candidatus Woesearchaeota archaeon]MBT4630893.1 hypothetical protein [Candidatus Woesearchaeota archaeon]